MFETGTCVGEKIYSEWLTPKTFEQIHSFKTLGKGQKE